MQKSRIRWVCTVKSNALRSKAKEKNNGVRCCKAKDARFTEQAQGFIELYNLVHLVNDKVDKNIYKVDMIP